MTPKNINLMTSYEIDQEIGHLEHLRARLTPEGQKRLRDLKAKKDGDALTSSYTHRHEDDDSSILSSAIEFGLGSMFSSFDSSPSIDTGSSFSAGGGDFGGGGAGSDW